MEIQHKPLNSDFPTRNVIAERVIRANNHLHLDANNADNIESANDGIAVGLLKYLEQEM